MQDRLGGVYSFLQWDMVSTVVRAVRRGFIGYSIVRIVAFVRIGRKFGTRVLN